MALTVWSVNESLGQADTLLETLLFKSYLKSVNRWWLWMPGGRLLQAAGPTTAKFLNHIA